MISKGDERPPESLIDDRNLRSLDNRVQHPVAVQESVNGSSFYIHSRQFSVLQRKGEVSYALLGASNHTISWLERCRHKGMEKTLEDATIRNLLRVDMLFIRAWEER